MTSRAEAVREEFDSLAEDYEFKRWFSDRGQWENYRAMRETLRQHLPTQVMHCLEVGCGPGTWTRFFLQLHPNARFTLVDISPEMLSQAKLSLGLRKNITYVQGDFLTAELPAGHDFFFSSRAVEYVQDKGAFCRRIHGLLAEGGKGIIVTKNPEMLSRRLERLLRRPISDVHSGRIGPHQLRSAMKAAGFRDIKVYPCVVSFPPGRKSFSLSRVLWRRMHSKELSQRWSWLAESYLLTFMR